ncbi:MAG: malate synthase, partial [Gammaproteobacteria bacterium]|nr:malate synthase [Gammaproteobacteria bacterium]
MTTQQQSALVNTGPARIAVSGEQHERFDEILTPAALDFLLQLNQRFTPNLKDLLDARVARQADIDSGELPGFREDTRHIREAEWWVAEIPAELRDRRVEITGPAERKMMINALNSGACVFMADIEDSLSPTWHNVIQAQVNLKDAVNGCIEYTNLEGKTYRLEEDTAVLIVRPRGLHLPEKHVLADDEPLPGALVDFGLFFFHNARALVDKKSGPYFYIPKLETAEEAEWWADVFQFAEEYLELPHGTIKATVLIETILAAFEMDEILYAMREYIIGLNCGRWDYIFSFIKKFHKHPEFILPDRNAVTMTRHFLRSYSRLLIKTCHRRGAYAMGGMAAQIPIK